VKALTVAGGIYIERCIWPEWNEVYGSAGRAAAAVADHVDQVRLVSYAPENVRLHFELVAGAYGFQPDIYDSPQEISFSYFHTLSTPVVTPAPALIRRQAPLSVEGDAVLRFGMMESTVIVHADKCVYDPQSAYSPEDFSSNGSTCRELAIVANSAEIIALASVEDPIQAATSLVERGVSTVVVVKRGPQGAAVVQRDRVDLIPAFQSEFVWTLGTGDVFAATFAARWAVHDEDAVLAAMIASKAVRKYVENKSLPIPKIEELNVEGVVPVSVVQRTVYLAGPFFCMSQRWLVEEARRYLLDFGLKVFSPIHDVGKGRADFVAPADLAGLDRSDVVFALLDGLDPGTLFEVGYANAKNIPVYALAQAVSEEDLKMYVGSGCRVFSDFVTAIHRLAWSS
jgi:hypothetical protein